MKTFLRTSVFAITAIGLYAQTVTPTVPTLATTGAIAVAEGQAARFNVVNPGATACSAQVAFLGDDGKTIKTAMLSVNPGAAGAIGLDGDVELKLIADERREIRATVISSCKLIGTVEIYDKFTGRTQASLGGLHTVDIPVAASVGN